MLRGVEFLLFFAPFGLFAAWWYLGERASARVTWGILGLLVIVAAATVWYGLERSLPRGESYVPAHMENGRIVEGRGVRR